MRGWRCDYCHKYEPFGKSVVGWLHLSVIGPPLNEMTQEDAHYWQFEHPIGAGQGGKDFCSNECNIGFIQNEYRPLIEVVAEPVLEPEPEPEPEP